MHGLPLRLPGSMVIILSLVESHYIALINKWGKQPTSSYIMIPIQKLFTTPVFRIAGDVFIGFV